MISRIYNVWRLTDEEALKKYCRINQQQNRIIEALNVRQFLSQMRPQISCQSLPGIPQLQSTESLETSDSSRTRFSAHSESHRIHTHKLELSEEL